MRRTDRCSSLLALAGALLAISASPSGAEPASPPDANRPVRIRLHRYSLAEICRVFEAQSGVRHAASNLEVGDLMASMVGTASVPSFRAALEDVLPIKWHRETVGGKLRYVAEMSIGKRREEGQLLADYDRRWRADVEMQLKAATSAEALQRLPATYKGNFDSPANAAAWRVLASLPPEQQSALAAGRAVLRTGTSVSPDGVEAIQSVYVAAQQGRPFQPGDPSGAALLVKPVGGNLYLNLRHPGLPTMLISLMVGTPFRENRDPSIFQQPHVDHPDESVPLPEKNEGLPGRHPWEEVLDCLESTLHHPVVSDAVHDKGGNVTALPLPYRATIASYLDENCRKGWRRRWGKVGEVVTLETIEAPLLRRRDIPESSFRRWRRALAKDGALSLQDLGEMALLSDYRIGGLNGVSGQSFSNESALETLVLTHRPFLRLWGSLPGLSQRAAGQNGLALGMVPRQLVPLASILLSPEARLQVAAGEGRFAYSILGGPTGAVSQEGAARVDETRRKALEKEEQDRDDVLRKHLVPPS